jgi:hypothetical protein
MWSNATTNFIQPIFLHCKTRPLAKSPPRALASPKPYANDHKHQRAATNMKSSHVSATQIAASEIDFSGALAGF